MSVYAITGNTGSGKSYMAAKLIADQIKRGREVVTNIPMLIESPKLKLFSWDDIKDPSKAFAAGALYVIDEVWKEIPGGTAVNKIHLRIMHFFKEHRHYKAPDGQTIDIYLVTQDAGTDIAKGIRQLIKQTCLCHEPLDLGQKDLRVRYFYTGAVEGVNPELIRVKLTKTERFKLDSAVFKLYKSHTQAEAAITGDVIEQTGTATIWQSWQAKGWAAAVVSAILIGGWGIYRSVTVIAPKYQQTAAQRLNGDAATDPTGNLTQSANPVPSAIPPAVASAPAKKNDSLKWRLVGDLTINGQRWAFMTDKTGRARRLPMEQCRDEWDYLVCEYDGETVSMNTGPLPNDNTGQIPTAAVSGFKS
ncbi:hypothetical protein BJL95_21350 [Methylomonas sp. LWB]|uniref:zonular occludens toxin domain-containing protein n=1 Tax=Methylomonas sp. LWB TaxID=1905845 RepID=UPI0008D941D0|nr:zonular occludens toxin domain-containing protein [Methylomonas sp. LWB]OHX37215.1 hypothetical protein BJL95_21350 [Methylomonas sp. LWB]